MTSPPPARLRVLLADDHVGFAASVSRFLSPALDIVGVAANGWQALELATRLQPDVVVLDVAMPELDGFQTLDLLRRTDPDTRVVFLTMHGDDDFVSAAIDAGAYGYDAEVARLRRSDQRDRPRCRGPAIRSVHRRARDCGGKPARGPVPRRRIAT